MECRINGTLLKVIKNASSTDIKAVFMELRMNWLNQA